jgi:hypothetical protein
MKRNWPPPRVAEYLPSLACVFGPYDESQPTGLKPEFGFLDERNARTRLVVESYDDAFQHLGWASPCKKHQKSESASYAKQAVE